MKAFTPLCLLVFLVLLILMPFLFAELMAASLVKLHLSTSTAMLVVLGIFICSVVNIPVKRIEHFQSVIQHPLGVFGLDRMWPGMSRVSHETIIAVNVGGCVIPAGLAIYELLAMGAGGAGALLPVAVASVVNIIVCYRVARLVPGVGIVIPGLVPAIGAAVLALILAPHDAAPVAFVAGVAGPLIGADLLHLREIERSATGTASIGGAGTFDGIVLSGIIAAYLA
jgi:uncharacterized membrane protein